MPEVRAPDVTQEEGQIQKTKLQDSLPSHLLQHYTIQHKVSGPHIVLNMCLINSNCHHSLSLLYNAFLESLYQNHCNGPPPGQLVKDSKSFTGSTIFEFEGITEIT